MNPPNHASLSRRRFVGQCCAAVGATGMLSSLASLRLMGAAASVSPASSGPGRAGAIAPDYKALVCVFLQGGNDGNNMIVPTGAGYGAYAAARSNLALPAASLLPLAPRSGDGRTFGLHPAMPELHSLFGAGRAAILANVGTLVVPTTQAQYRTNAVPLPPQLYSHNDQQVQWQHSVPDRPPGTGWGGRIADLVSAFNASERISMSISLAGANLFQVGSRVAQYAVSTSGIVTFDGAGAGADGLTYQAQRDTFAQSQPGLFAGAFGGVTGRAITDSEFLAATLRGTPSIATPFPATHLGAQLRMVARLIAASSSLGLKRQVFFVQQGGWDLHASQVDQGSQLLGAHAALLSQVSQGLNAFHQATVELGVANQVTAFTASDFGRTYRSNGDGSDHGWGNHQLMVGGAVKGGEVYGRVPDLVINGPDDTGQGRWIPTTSVDEYAATLASWFGVSATDLPVVLPNIGRFARPNLGFL